MIFDSKLFKQDESVSNPMAVGFRRPDCPINRTCFHVVVGPGTPIEMCQFFKDHSTEEARGAECTYDSTAGGT